jgi:hypothetical protein
MSGLSLDLLARIVGSGWQAEQGGRFPHRETNEKAALVAESGFFVGSRGD